MTCTVYGPLLEHVFYYIKNGCYNFAGLCPG